MNTQHAGIAFIALFCLLSLFVGIYEWVIADEVVHDAVCIALMTIGPVVILDYLLLEKLDEKLSRLEKEGEREKDEA